jgi:hypothetical protein
LGPEAAESEADGRTRKDDNAERDNCHQASPCPELSGA